MTEKTNPDSRWKTAERNRQAILGAAEDLLRGNRRATVSAIAAESGLSRVTVYAHFREANEILEAVVARAVGQAAAAIEAAEPDRGAPDEALDRVLGVGWEEIGRNAAVAQAAAVELGPGAMRRSHAELLAVVRRLVERGHDEGAFRDDLDTEWLLGCFFSLVHMAHEEVRAGRIDSERALEQLTTTVGGLFTGRGPSARASAIP
jgi:AcrR family transcriptional regulator